MSTVSRRGQYSVLFVLGLIPLMALGAVAVDVGLLSVHASQAETVAYAAAHTAIVAYAEGKDTKEAEALARQAVADHPAVIDGVAYELMGLQWGRVDRASGDFSVDKNIQAAEAQVQRTADVSTLFGVFTGSGSVQMGSQAVSEQIPSLLHTGACDLEIPFTRPGGELLVGMQHDLHRSVNAHIADPPPSGWYRLYKAGLSESGNSQRNESAVFRLTNPTNPSGLPLASEANCGDEYVMRDYDNSHRGHFKLKERIYLGTFYFDEEGPNTLEMRHYCAFVDECPQFHDTSQPCGSMAHSIHLKQGWALCGEAL